MGGRTADTDKAPPLAHTVGANIIGLFFAFGHRNFNNVQTVQTFAGNIFFKHTLYTKRKMTLSYKKMLMKLLMDLLMKLLIKSDWRGIFMAYLIDFQQKHISLGDYPTSSAILDKNPLFSTGSFFLRKLQKKRAFKRKARFIRTIKSQC